MDKASSTCSECGKEVKNLKFHIWRAHTEEGRSLSSRTGKKGKHQPTGSIPWNKGLTKDTDDRVKEHAEKLLGRSFGFVNGSKHTAESKAKIAESMRGNSNGNHRGDRQSYFGSIRMDSSWEVKVAQYLTDQNIMWEYGSHVFNIDDKRSYRPDFKLSDGSFIEVKGYWREANKSKFIEFQNKFPEIRIEVWDKDKLKDLGLL